MVGILGLGADYNDNTDNAAEEVDQGPPGVVRKVAMESTDDGADEGDDPCELCATVSIGAGRKWRAGQATHNADGDGRQGEGVAEDVVEAKAVAGAVIHLLKTVGRLERGHLGGGAGGVDAEDLALRSRGGRRESRECCVGVD